MPSKSKPQEEVIKEFIEVHGDKYDYSKVIYVRGDKNITIICPIHGDFQLRADKHKYGRGCKDCGYLVYKEEKLNKARNSLVEKFREVHGDFYNYDKVVYNRNDEKVIITCPVHGDFPQAPAGHKRGEICPDCSYEKRSSIKIEKTKTTLIKDFKKAHGDFYNYDKVEYVKGVSSVTITCPIHGDFPQTPSSHKAGKGCHKCAIEISSGWTHTNWQKAAEKSKKFDSFKVYIIRCWNDEEEFYKIGKTFKKVKSRFNAKYHMPYNYEIVLEEVFENAREASIRETSLKSKNRDIKYIPSIYFRGIQECFSKNPCTD